MNKRLLTFDDLYNFYSKYTRAKHFNCEEQGCEPIVVQTPATIKFEESDIFEGLTAVRLQACHTERNLNSSSISKEVMENKLLPTLKNRPILGYIHTVDGEPQFYGHNMHIDPDDDDNIIYDEIPVGIIPESNEASLEYDESEDHYNVFVSGYIFDEYTKATDIIEREQELAVSVEISIKQMSYSPKDSCLNIEDGYFSGVTILGVDDNGNEVKPGMKNSNIKLKDFSRSNNSFFTGDANELNTKLIDTLEKLDKTLSDISMFNINAESADNILKEGGNGTVKFEELLEKYGKTVDDIDFEYENLSDKELEQKFAEEFEEDVKKPSSDDDVADDPEDAPANDPEDDPEDDSDDDPDDDSTEGNDPDVSDDPDETDDSEGETFEVIEKSFEKDGKKFSVSFELSHEDVRWGLYNLLGQYEEMDNEWYNIRAVYDDHFVFQGWWNEKIYGQKYTKDDETVSFDGERYELYEELLTASEKAELDSMRANYSVIQNELNTYKAAEAYADKMTIFDDEAYAQFLDTPEFKELMKKDTVNKYSKEELADKADIAFSKLVKKNKTFALENSSEKKPQQKMFAFGRIEQKSSFLDGLLNQSK